MKVYLDLVFLLNFTFDFLLLLAVSLLLKRKASIKRLFLGALIGSTSLIVLFIKLNSILLFLFKVFLSVLMILGAFGYHDKAYFFKNFIYLYFVSIFLGGGMYLFNLQFNNKNNGLSISFLALIVLDPLLLYYYVDELKKLPFHNHVHHEITLYLTNNKTLSLKAYLDTGNQLYDPYQHRPILLVSSKKIKIPYEKAIIVPYETASGQGILKCQKISKMVIDNDKEISNVLIAEAKDNFHLENTEALLHPDFLK